MKRISQRVAVAVLSAGAVTLTGFSGTADAAVPAPETFTCNIDVKVISTSLTSAGARTICSKLEGTRRAFLDIFNGGAAMGNAPGDRTVGVDMYIYKNNAEYVAGAAKLGFPTKSNPNDNAGSMFENNALRANNRAAVVVRSFDDDVSNPFNLEHEFVHYLTFRHLLRGATDAPIWFSEGLAEDLGHPEKYRAAVNYVRNSTYDLSDILANESRDDSDLVYLASRAAVEYFLVERQDELGTLFDALHDGDETAYATWVEEIGTSLDGDFTRWLETQ